MFLLMKANRTATNNDGNNNINANSNSDNNLVFDSSGVIEIK